MFRPLDHKYLWKNMWSLTNWTKRNITIDLSFLDKGNYEVELFSDGFNADRAARDYKRDIFPLPENQKLSVTLMPGGGFAAKIKEK
jgi:alpha-glucosidase